MASICGSPVCAGGKPKMKFTYTGDYVVRKDGVVELLTSGTIVFLEPKVIDLFMVGGGGGGGDFGGTAGSSALAGGGGGYTRTVRRVNVSANTEIPVTVGAGGAVNSRGGSSAFNTVYSVLGGYSALPYSNTNSTSLKGGHGGSGGGGAVISNSDYGAGGYDGNDGEAGYGLSNISGGTGQHTTTKEFGETSGKLYAGGGGGGRYIAGSTFVISPGGSGGGGSGACGHGSDAQAAAAGVANTGGGGGGAAASYNNVKGAGGSGGSGIVCFRETVELPELAGTWVMNNRIYQPETSIKELVNFTMPGYTVASYNAKGVRIAGAPATPASIFGIWKSTEATEQYLAVYDFYTNKWANTKDLSPAVLTFPVGAIASNEFRAWLASNATKQA